MRSQKLKGSITPEKAALHARILANSVKHRFRHLRKRFARENIHCFRLYDWDSPDIRVVVDWYAGHLVVAEYERKQTGPEYLPQMAQAVAQALTIDPENIHLKRRHTKLQDAPRYARIASNNKRFCVNERNLKFLVNLDDFIDTGLYSDHRDTRAIIAGIAKNKDFLNLFAYTGTFSCAAAAGGARRIATVDRSQAYIAWAKENMLLNGLMKPQYIFSQLDVIDYLKQARVAGHKFDLVFVDPPSFSQNTRGAVSFNILRDHPALLRETLKVMKPSSELFFSTNHQRFEPNFKGLNVNSILKITPKTIPPDYRNRNIHNCWQIKL